MSSPIPTETPDPLIPEPTPEDLADLDALPEARMARLSLLIDDKRYGVAVALPDGFPIKFEDEEAQIELYALQLASIAFETFKKHFADDVTPGPDVMRPEAPESEVQP
ncbi:hypothetical protein BKA24_001741 [Microbacterium marinum]|uniref:Uncharacterized protein n=1 Tax=Microbacterium marinum TaxID=421115 RepID=A0A7W7BQM0_9MICO|nr:hypothetical protein [Microbacterium marinum]MBB4667032.1 hypothetical protein [Microbacterium marinum]